MEGQSGLSELSVISWMSAFQGCPLRAVSLYSFRGPWLPNLLTCYFPVRGHNCIFRIKRPPHNKGPHPYFHSSICAEVRCHVLTSTYTNWKYNHWYSNSCRNITAKFQQYFPLKWSKSKLHPKMAQSLIRVNVTNPTLVSKCNFLRLSFCTFLTLGAHARRGLKTYRQTHRHTGQLL